MDFKTRARTYHNLAVMVESGLPVRRAIPAAVSGISGRFARAVAAINDGLKSGQTIAESMRQAGHVFAKMDVLLVEAGESSGELDRTFMQLARYYDFRQRTKRIIYSGLVMPAFIWHAAAVLLAIPRFIFSGFDVMSALYGIIQMWLVFWIPFLAILGVMKLTGETGIFRRFFDGLIIRLPAFKVPFKIMAIGRYCRTFHILSKSGVPITECCRQSCQLCGNTAIAKWFEGGIAATKRGEPVSAGFSPLLGADFINPWLVGEETGRLDDVTGRLADQYEDRAQYAFEEMAKWLPRIVYFIIMLILAFAVLAGWGALRTKMGAY
jgi:type II secretory pathway component PulF